MRAERMMTTVVGDLRMATTVSFPSIPSGTFVTFVLSKSTSSFLMYEFT